MVFNPLFLQVVNNQETQLLNKAQKLSGPSYLFSDIIKVQLDKNETGSLTAGKETAADNNLLSSIVSALSSQSDALPLAQMQNAPGINVNSALGMKSFNPNVLLQQMDKDASEEKDTAGSSEDINSLLVGNTELFNFINELLTNHQFDGKISIVASGDEGAENKDALKNPSGSQPLENLNAGEVLSLLKDGKTIAVENSAFQSNNGLLITLVELSGDAAKTQSGSTVVNSSGEEGAMPEAMNTASAQTLAGIMASQTAGTGDTDLQASGPLYKLKFSLVDNQEASGLAMGTEKPIIKLPFSNDMNAAANPETVMDESLKALSKDPAAAAMTPEGEGPALKSGNENAKIEPGTLKGTASTQTAPVVPEGSKGTPLVENEADSNTIDADGLLPDVKVKNEDTLKGEDDTVKGDPAEKNIAKDNAAKDAITEDNITKDPGVKSGKFINIERVKTDSGIQAKETKTPAEQQKIELPDQEISKKDLPASGTINSDEMKTQKTIAGTDKKMEETGSSKLQDAAALNQKEKDVKASSPQEKQDSSSPSEVKTETKDSAKNEMNSSSKEQNHQSPESSLSGDHPETKGKTQEDHAFNIGTQTKTGESTFTVKHTTDSSPFGEAAKTVKAAEVMKEISKFIQQGDRSSIVLKIDPESLGTVKIALDLADKVVHANIEVENEAARKLMENNLNQLYNSLNQNGLQLNSINISLANQEQKQGKMPNHKRRAFMDDGGKDSDEIGELRQKQMGYNTYDYLI